MAEITHTTTTTFGVRCDKRGCAATFELAFPIYEQGSSWQGMEAIKEQAPSAGWTLWVHRSREWRCPDHPMKAGKQRDRYSMTARRVLPPAEAVARG